MEEGRSSSTRASVYEAAEVMGVTVDAIRKRISRGTVPHERDEDGRVWVLLDADQDASGKVRDIDRSRSDSDALISEMRDRIASPERQLEQERQANSEHRRLLAAALERIPPQLEAPTDEASDARGSPERGEVGEDREQYPATRRRQRRGGPGGGVGLVRRINDATAGDRARESYDLEADKLQMEYFKHIGTLSLAAAVLIVTLFGAFGHSDPPALLLIAVFGSVFFFAVSLLTSIIGTYAMAEYWGVGNVFRFSRKRSRDRFVYTIRLLAFQMFFSGVFGFFFVSYAILNSLSKSFHP